MLLDFVATTWVEMLPKYKSVCKLMLFNRAYIEMMIIIEEKWELEKQS